MASSMRGRNLDPGNLSDWDDEDLFGPSSPKQGDKNDKTKNDKNSKQKTDALGIDKELNLKKKQRAPKVKLDDQRLLSEKGIPKLRKMAPRLKFKGKGHEFSDTARLLSFYQEWLDDLFPKATFLDALAMVEKAGHKTTVRNARLKWIDELRPKASFEDEGEDEHPIYTRDMPRPPEKVAPVFAKATGATTAQAASNDDGSGRERARTPLSQTIEDLLGDIYDATPRRNTTTNTAPARPEPDGDIPNDEDIDALMAEAKVQAAQNSGSIFGNGIRSNGSQPTRELNDDELDELMAEADAYGAQRATTAPETKRLQSTRELNDDELDGLMADAAAAEAEARARQRAARASQPASGPAANNSIFGDVKPVSPTDDYYGDDDDLDAIMVEAEALVSSQQAKPAEAGSADATTQAPEKPAAGGDDGDDLDALMAELEASAGSHNATLDEQKGASGGGTGQAQEKAGGDGEAEMEGLWE